MMHSLEYDNAPLLRTCRIPYKEMLLPYHFCSRDKIMTTENKGRSHSLMHITLIYYIPHQNDGIDIPRSLWSEDKKNKNVKKYIIAMWDILALAYEGMSRVKDSKNNMLIANNNNLRSLSKTYDNYDHIMKILRSLPR
ncbi:hypothetical protein CR513_44641, partial [Mucuna pruriens]